MTMVRYRPRSEWDLAGLAELQQEMNDLFGESLTRFRAPSWMGRADGDWTPSLDIYEDKESVHVKADLPGLARDDVEITLRDNLLTIKDEKKHETEVKEENYYRAERTYGAFTRSVQLPSYIDESKMTAKFRHGAVDICLPKTPGAKPKHIKIEEFKTQRGISGSYGRCRGALRGHRAIFRRSK